VNQRKQRGQSKLDSQFPALATASTRAICFEANFKLFIRDFRGQTQTDFRKKDADMAACGCSAHRNGSADSHGVLGVRRDYD
jgi:hypothetical protein